MIQLVFCHGFGFNYHFWDNLAIYFAKEMCSFMDLGYFKRPKLTFEVKEPRIVGIGHSLGLLKLMHTQLKFDYFIGINSFTNFLGSKKNLRQNRQIELAALQQKFIQNPIDTLKNFYQTCGIPEFENSCNFLNLNIKLLLSEFRLLLSSYIIPDGIPTLILNAKDDIIVPTEITEDNFHSQSNVEVHMLDHGQHSVGLRDPLTVYHKIMSFLHAQIHQ